MSHSIVRKSTGPVRRYKRPRSPWVHLNNDNTAAEGFGGPRSSEVAMKSPVLIVLIAIMLVAGSSLAIMNRACKSNHHAWCVQVSDIRHHVKTKHS